MISFSDSDKQWHRFLFPGQYPKKVRVRPSMPEEQILQIFAEMCEISDQQWALYSLYKDPLRLQIPGETARQIVKDSMECAVLEERKLKEKYDGNSLEEICAGCGISLEKADMQQGTSVPYLSTYTERPAKIQIYMPVARVLASCIEKTLCAEEKFGCTKGGDTEKQVTNIMIAHEIFHYLEMQNDTIYTRRKHIENQQFGFLKSKATVSGASEIAANYFAKLWNNSELHPSVLELLYLCVTEPEEAYRMKEQLLAVEESFHL